MSDNTKQSICITSLEIPDAFLIQPKVFSDQRGLFYETYTKKFYQDSITPDIFVQDNLSISKQNVLRGLHFQKKFPQGKLVSVLRGKIYDVVVDLRKDSPFFGKYIGLWLDDALRQQLYIPPGCAHGFYVTSDEAIVHYKCTDYYHAEDEGGIMWNEPVLNIQWPLIDAPIVSDKDNQYVPFVI